MKVEGKGLKVNIEEFKRLLDNPSPWGEIKKEGFYKGRHKGQLWVSHQTYEDSYLPWRFEWADKYLLFTEGDYEWGEGLVETALQYPEVLEILDHL